MTGGGKVYGGALYALAKEEALAPVILTELRALGESFRQEPVFLTLLGAPGLGREERLGILEVCFRGKVHPYLLNFLKILTEKGKTGEFFHCWEAYECFFDRDQGIWRITAVSAAPLSAVQTQKLREMLGRLTGKKIRLLCRRDPTLLGGIRLDWEGGRLDGTVAHRLRDIRKLLEGTSL